MANDLDERTNPVDARVAVLEANIGMIKDSLLDIRREMPDFRRKMTDLRKDFSGFRDEARKGLVSFREEVRKEFQDVRVEIAHLRGRVETLPATMQMITLVFGKLGGALVILRFGLPHTWVKFNQSYSVKILRGQSLSKNWPCIKYASRPL